MNKSIKTGGLQINSAIIIFYYGSSAALLTRRRNNTNTKAGDLTQIGLAQKLYHAPDIDQQPNEKYLGTYFKLVQKYLWRNNEPVVSWEKERIAAAANNGQEFICFDFYSASSKFFSVHLLSCISSSCLVFLLLSQIPSCNYLRPILVSLVASWLTSRGFCSDHSRESRGVLKVSGVNNTQKELKLLNNRFLCLVQ